MIKTFSEFEELIGISFSNKELLQRAFTHRSFLNENKDRNLKHNERLEFLGDAVLELVVTHFLFEAYPDKPEGELTAVRAALVNTQTLAQTAGKIGMNDFLLLSRGESKDVGRARQFILANTFEAVVGALYLDQGYDVVDSFLRKHICPLAEDIVEQRLWQDAKSRFQESAQERVSITPIYTVLNEDGPDHDKHFTVGVFLEDECVAEGSGHSKQEAEQVAAEKAIQVKGW